MKTLTVLFGLILSLSAFASSDELKIFTSAKTLTTNGRGEPARLCGDTEIEGLIEAARAESLKNCRESGVVSCIQESDVAVSNEIEEEWDCNDRILYGRCSAVVVTQGSSRKNFGDVLKPGTEFSGRSMPARRGIGEFCNDADHVNQLIEALRGAVDSCVASGYAADNCATLYVGSAPDTILDKHGMLVDVCVGLARVRGYK